MKAVLRVENPDDMEFTLTVTMTLGGWKRLRDQMDTVAWPANDFRRAITDMVSKAGKHFRPDHPDVA